MLEENDDYEDYIFPFNRPFNSPKIPKIPKAAKLSIVKKS